MAALLALGSCWSPVFNPDVSLAALTASKLSLDVQFTGLEGGSSNTTGYLAVPSPFRPPTQVSVASLSLTGLGLTLMTNTNGTWEAASSNSGGQNYDSAIPNAQLTTLSAGFDGASLASFQPGVGGGTVSFIDAGSTTQYSTGVVLGASAYPTSAAVTLYALVVPVLGSNTVTVLPFGSSTGVPFANTPGATVGTGTYTGSTTYGWLVFDPINLVAYLTHYPKSSSGQYTTDKIQFTATTATLAGSWTRSDRVAAFLTTGQLLTRDGGYYDVCNAGGSIQSTFAAGSLTFAGEYYDAGTSAYRCWFTEVLSTNGAQSSSSVNVRVYSVPTSQLGSL